MTPHAGGARCWAEDEPRVACTLYSLRWLLEEALLGVTPYLFPVVYIVLCHVYKEEATLSLNQEFKFEILVCVRVLVCASLFKN